MTEGQVFHASHEGVHVLRLVGEIRYPLCPALEGFVHELFAQGAPAGFVVDLSATECIDSANLGVLARIAERMRVHGRPRVTIVAGKPDINEVLESLAFDEVFDITRHVELPLGEARPVVLEEADREVMARTLLDAHRALMVLSEHNQEVFQDVVQVLERRAAATPPAG